MQKATASFDIRNLAIIFFSQSLHGCCHGYTTTIPFIFGKDLSSLREIAIQEVHPCLAGLLLNEARIAAP
jgi:hypothetical protein